jgi:hypothetical protein
VRDVLLEEKKWVKIVSLARLVNTQIQSIWQVAPLVLLVITPNRRAVQHVVFHALKENTVLTLFKRRLVLVLCVSMVGTVTVLPPTMQPSAQHVMLAATILKRVVQIHRNANHALPVNGITL